MSIYKSVGAMLTPPESDKRLKVVHVIASVDPASGGPIEGILRSAEVWQERYLGERHIACLDRPDDPWVAQCPLKVFPLGAGFPAAGSRGRLVPWRRYGYAPRLARWIRDNARNYDAVIVNGLWNYAAFAARQGLANSNTPYFVFPHGMLDPWFRRAHPLKHLAKQAFWWINEGPLLNRAAATLFTSEEEKHLAEKVFRPYRLKAEVLGYGTADVQGDPAQQMAAFRQQVPALGSRPFLLFLSRIHPKKGCDLLIEAFAAIADAHPDLDLVIAGPDQTGWRATLERLALQKGIEARVHWPGMLTGDAKFGAYRAAEAFILPSHQENFGLVVAEAMACAKPVLITRQVNIWREVEASGGGIAGIDDLAGVTKMCRDFLALAPASRAAMGEAARRGFEAHFKIETAAVKLAALIRRTVAERNR